MVITRAAIISPCPEHPLLLLLLLLIVLVIETLEHEHD